MPRERILLVESDSDTASRITQLLNSLGYIVAGRVSQGKSAVQKTQELKPSLVLMNIRIEGDLKITESARQIIEQFQIPVIFFSPNPDTLTLQNAMLAQAYGFITNPFDTSELKSNITLAAYKFKMEARLRESEERYALAVRAANDGIWDWNLKTNKIYYSPRWKQILGYKEDEIGDESEEWFKRVYGPDQKQVQTELVSHLRGHTSQFQIEYRMRHADGSILWVISRGLALRDSDGRAYRIVGSQTDIHARKLAEERLEFGALHDSLTGLPNRALFMDRLNNRLQRSRRNPEELFAVMFMDLDRFKVVNDSLGHTVGDQLLVITAQRLQKCLRIEDTVARLGGDEFAILIDRINEANDVLLVAERIKAHLVATTVLGSVERFPTASIGIVIHKGNYSNPEDLLRDADAAMYHAKSAGGNDHRLFDESMHADAVELIRLEGELERAVERSEWRVEYQPIYSLADQKIIGAEALVRWVHPRRGIIYPHDFIHIAEETGHVLAIGDYVMRAACQQARAWRELGHENFWVAVNISGRQFQDKKLVELIQNILAETGLPSNGLRLEITESVAMQDTEFTAQTLNELKNIGVGTSIDDFGTGYSSLNYLKALPLHTLKIDQSFIHDIQNANNKSLTMSIIHMARLLNLEIIAEGVEEEDQLAFLRSQACDNVQGYLLSRPVSGADFTKLLQ